MSDANVVCCGALAIASNASSRPATTTVITTTITTTTTIFIIITLKLHFSFHYLTIPFGCLPRLRLPRAPAPGVSSGGADTKGTSIMGSFGSSVLRRRVLRLDSRAFDIALLGLPTRRAPPLIIASITTSSSSLSRPTAPMVVSRGRGEVVRLLG